MAQPEVSPEQDPTRDRKPLEDLGTPLQQISFIALVAVLAALFTFLPCHALVNYLLKPTASLVDSDGVGVLRTPPEYFQHLTDWPYEPQYLHPRGGDALRLAYVDVRSEADVDSDCEVIETVLLLHGNLVWGYMWRSTIAELLSAGCVRVVAPDLLGFGRSDKSTRASQHSPQAHLAAIERLLRSLDWHHNVSLVAHGWGSVVGQHLIVRRPDTFSRLLLVNGYHFPSGRGGDGQAALMFRAYAALHAAWARHTPWYSVGGAVAFATSGGLREPQVAAYDAPFPSHGHKQGPLALAGMLPTGGGPYGDVHGLVHDGMRHWTKPCVLLASGMDVYTRGHAARLRRDVPGCSVQFEIDGGHYAPERSGQAVARRLMEMIGEADRGCRNAEEAEQLCQAGVNYSERIEQTVAAGQ